MPGAVRLGRLGGIEVRVHASWLVLFALFSSSLALGYFPTHHPAFSPATAWLLGILGALLLLGSVLIHELSHAWVARAHGVDVHAITLFIFGGVASLAGDVLQPRIELLIAAAGPTMSLLVSVLCYVISRALETTSAEVAALLGYLATVNLVLAIFNLAPGLPLDGGRLLHAVVWQATGSQVRATRIAAVAGQLVAYGLLFWGFWQFLGRDIVGGVWLVLISWFLLTAARRSAQEVTVEQLAGVPVSAAMDPEPIAVPAHVSVQGLVDDYILRHKLTALPVVEAGRWVGVVTLQDVMRVPRAAWWATRVAAVMRPRDGFAMVAPDDALRGALKQLAARPHDQLPVVAGEELVGMLTGNDVQRYLQIRATLARTEHGLPRAGATSQPLP